MNHGVYLAGPMEGLTKEQMSGWRDPIVQRFLNRTAPSERIDPLDPCDRMPFRDQVMSDGADNVAGRIVTQDVLDIRASRVVLMNLSQIHDLELRAWGSISELVIAHYEGVPTVVVLPTTMTDIHPFVLYYATEVHYDLETATRAVESYFR